MPPEFAIERLRDLCGSMIDPGCFAALEAVVKRRATLVFLDDSDAA
jgi:HD-GYP domain-containing protein (c-di-GMP phosphodiesterase class II)